MTGRVIVPVPLTSAAFAPFGDVIEPSGSANGMNSGAFERYDDLARIECDPAGRPAIGLVRCRAPASAPCEVSMLERHPLGSQAFVPLGDFSYLVVVAPPGDGVDPGEIAAFVAAGMQGINYRRGTWHMPLRGWRTGQSFLVVDRHPGHGNCEELAVDPPVTVDWRP